MRKRLFVIAALVAGSLLVSTQIKPKQADAWIAPGYSMQEYSNCIRCEPGGESCNVSAQFCDDW